MAAKVVYQFREPESVVETIHCNYAHVNSGCLHIAHNVDKNSGEYKATYIPLDMLSQIDIFTKKEENNKD